MLVFLRHGLLILNYERSNCISFDLLLTALFSPLRFNVIKGTYDKVEPDVQKRPPFVDFTLSSSSHMFALSFLLFIHFLGSLVINTSEKWDAPRQNVSRTFIPSSVNRCKHQSQKHLSLHCTFCIRENCIITLFI